MNFPMIDLSNVLALHKHTADELIVLLRKDFDFVQQFAGRGALGDEDHYEIGWSEPDVAERLARVLPVVCGHVADLEASFLDDADAHSAAVADVPWAVDWRTGAWRSEQGFNFGVMCHRLMLDTWLMRRKRADEAGQSFTEPQP